jgi:hypothetical protein
MTNHVHSLWKPIKGPVYNWPLTLCDRRTVDHSRQAIPMDVLTPDCEIEIARLLYDPEHKWYYFKGQATNEATVFMQADSENPNAGRTSLLLESNWLM